MEFIIKRLSEQISILKKDFELYKKILRSYIENIDEFAKNCVENETKILKKELDAATAKCLEIVEMRKYIVKAKSNSRNNNINSNEQTSRNQPNKSVSNVEINNKSKRNKNSPRYDSSRSKNNNYNNKRYPHKKTFSKRPFNTKHKTGSKSYQHKRSRLNAISKHRSTNQSNLNDKNNLTTIDTQSAHASHAAQDHQEAQLLRNNNQKNQSNRNYQPNHNMQQQYKFFRQPTESTTIKITIESEFPIFRVSERVFKLDDFEINSKYSYDFFRILDLGLKFSICNFNNRINFLNFFLNNLDFNLYKFNKYIFFLKRRLDNKNAKFSDVKSKNQISSKEQFMNDLKSLKKSNHHTLPLQYETLLFRKLMHE